MMDELMYEQYVETLKELSESWEGTKEELLKRLVELSEGYGLSGHPADDSYFDRNSDEEEEEEEY